MESFDFLPAELAVTSLSYFRALKVSLAAIGPSIGIESIRPCDFGVMLRPLRYGELADT